VNHIQMLREIITVVFFVVVEGITNKANQGVGFYEGFLIIKSFCYFTST